MTLQYMHNQVTRNPSLMGHRGHHVHSRDLKLLSSPSAIHDHTICRISTPRKVFQSQRMLHAWSLMATSMETPEAAGAAKRVEWFNKQKELWVEPTDKAGLETLIHKNDTGKPLVLDCYAGWCSSCKSAYPALCKIASNKDFRKNFTFAKADIQKPGIIGFIRSLGVKGIPTIMVFDEGGELLCTFGASFKKMNVVKANLVVIGANPGSTFRTDPNGFVMPKPDDQG